jgi:hypothetical protein
MTRVLQRTDRAEHETGTDCIRRRHSYYRVREVPHPQGSR